MPDFTKRVRSKLTLPGGEEVVQAAVAQPKGSISRGFAEKRTAAGALTSSISQKNSADPSEAIADRVPTKNGYLVVTSHRLLWASQRRTGSVGEIVAEFSFSEIESAHTGEGGGTSNKLVTLAFADGSSSELAVAKGQHPEKLTSALNAALD